MESNPMDPAMDRMSVAPGPDGDNAGALAKGEGGRGPVTSADAGTDTSITERLARNPESKDARLDRALDESMDASDPPASTQPVHNQQPPESSGYDPKAEKKMEAEAAGVAGTKGLLGKVAQKLGLS